MNETTTDVTSSIRMETNLQRLLPIPPRNWVSKQPTNACDDYSFYVNREPLWLEFNRCVLAKASDTLTPPMEKLKFTSIFSSSLDEYVMMRVGGLTEAARAGVNDLDPCGKTAQEQLDDIAGLIKALVSEQYLGLMNDILPGVRKSGIFIHNINEIGKSENSRLDEYFNAQVFPILTPLAVDAGHPFPFLTNLRLNLMIIFEEASIADRLRAYAFVEVPSVLPRLVRVNTGTKGYHYVLLEDLIREHISSLFHGMDIKQTIAFRVTRNSDQNSPADEAVELLQSVDDEFKERSHQIAIRLEIESDVPRRYISTLTKELDIEDQFAYEIHGPLRICDLLPLWDLPVNA